MILMVMANKMTTMTNDKDDESGENIMHKELNHVCYVLFVSFVRAWNKGIC